MSSYVQGVLSGGEDIKYEAKVSMWSMTPLFILGLLFLPLYGFGLLFWLIAYLRYISTELAVTNKKVIAKFGFIRRDTIELLLPKIESIQVNQTLFGRMLNYGSVVVSGAGNPQAPIPGISNPIEFRKQFMDIQEQISG
jgi:uncharacterized membrane protein YdbT with pleckstrin-like domain